MQFSHLNNTQQRGVKILAVGGAILAAGTTIALGGILGDVYGHEHPNPPNATQLTAHAQHGTHSGLTTSNVFELMGAFTLSLGWCVVGPGLFTIWQGMTGGENTALVHTL